ncbi:MAG: glycosyltransferase [Leptospirales bacterium]
MDQPLISVIMPCYNHEKYVEQSILSVIGQPYKNVELIAIDDGSKDQTPEILKGLAQKHGFYHELQETNKGVCHTINKAIGLARGRYIKFLASDDFLHDQSLGEFVNRMENDAKIDVCFGDLIQVDKEGNQVRFLKSGLQSRFQSKFPVNSVVDISPDMAIQVSPIIGPSFLIKKSVLDEFGPFDENQIVEDWDLFLFLVCHSKNISYIPAVAGFYRTFPPQDRPYRRDHKKQFLTDIHIITKYKKNVDRKSFEIAIKNLVRLYVAIAVSSEESPAYFLGYAKKHLSLLSLFTDFKFLKKIFDFYKKTLITNLRSRLHR